MRTDLPTLDRIFAGVFLLVCAGLAIYAVYAGEYTVAGALVLGAVACDGEMRRAR